MPMSSARLARIRELEAQLPPHLLRIPLYLGDDAPPPPSIISVIVEDPVSESSSQSIEASVEASAEGSAEAERTLSVPETAREEEWTTQVIPRQVRIDSRRRAPSASVTAVDIMTPKSAPVDETAPKRRSVFELRKSFME